MQASFNEKKYRATPGKSVSEVIYTDDCERKLTSMNNISTTLDTMSKGGILGITFKTSY